MTYTQCRLIKQLDVNTKLVTVSWIPSKYATIGKFVLINGESYVVDSVGNTREENEILDVHKISKGLWKATSGEEPKGHK